MLARKFCIDVLWGQGFPDCVAFGEQRTSNLQGGLQVFCTLSLCVPYPAAFLFDRGKSAQCPRIFWNTRNFQSFEGNQSAKKNHIIHFTCHGVPLTHGNGMVSLPDAMTCSMVLWLVSTNMKTSNVSCIWLLVSWQSLWLYLRGISMLI